MPFDPLGWWTDALNYTSKQWRSGAFDADVVARKAVVLHITDGVDSRSTLGSANSKVSAHFLNRQEGVYQHVSIFDTSYANGLSYKNGRWIDPAGNVVNPPWQGLTPPTNPNYTTISIENEGRPGIPLSPKQQQQLTNLLRALAVQYPQFMPYVPGVNLIGHRDIAPIHRARCPGPAFDFNAIAAAANADLLDAPTQPGQALLTEDAPIISAPRATLEQCTKYIFNRAHTNYDEYDIGQVILPRYFEVCQQVGVDPLVAISQMIHETGNLCSFWSAQPQRNPAGIGVNGRTSSSQIAGYAWNADRSGRWEAGVSFKTWAADAIPAHVGRLLAYALPHSAWNDAQRELVSQALEYRPLASKMWGSAPTLKQLGKAHNPTGDGWASPGQLYGQQIANVMNAIRGQG